MKRILYVSTAVAVSAIAVMAFRPVNNQAPHATKTKNSFTPVATKWLIDKVHTNVLFSVTHLVVSDVEGKFKSFDGSLESDKPDFSDANVSFIVDVSSISTDNDQRDNHLKSDDFLN